MSDFITSPVTQARVEEFLEAGWSILFYRNSQTYCAVISPDGTAAEDGFTGSGGSWDDATEAALDAMDGGGMEDE